MEAAEDGAKQRKKELKIACFTKRSHMQLRTQFVQVSKQASD
jgi:hypothetical protein